VLLPSQPPWVRRVVIAAVALAILVGAYALAGFVGVPRWLRSGLTDYVSTHYHRTLSLGEIHFNPFTLTLDVRNISFPDADSTPMLSAGRLHVQLRYASLWRRAASFQEILLDRPYAHVLVRPDGSLNLADLAKPFPGAAPPPRTPPSQSSPPRLSIDRLAVTEGRSTYEDRSRPTPFRAELLPITFDLRNFSTLGTALNEYSLEFATPLGERFRWSGTLGVRPVASRGRFEVDALRAHTLWSYLSDTLHFDIPSGTIAAQGDYLLAAAPTLELQVNVNRLAVSDLGIRPRLATTDDVHLQLIEVRGTRLDWAKRSLAVGTVRLTGGTIAAWINADKSVNLTELMGPATRTAAASSGAAPANPGATATPATPAWSIAVPDISVTGLELTAEDRTLRPAPTLDLDAIEVHVRNFHMPGEAQLDVSAGARVNHSGRIDAAATYTLGSAAAHAKLRLAQIDLSALQPYVAQRSALNLLSGQLATQLDVDRSTSGALIVTGDIAVAHLRTVDQALHQDFVTWDRLSVEGIRYRSQPASLSIRRIVAVKPFARVIVASNRSLNITEAFSPAHTRASGATAPSSEAPAPVKTSSQSGPAPASTPRAASTMAISLGRVQISNASARYTDLWIEPHFTLAIQELSGDITGMSSDPRSRAKIQLDGKVDRYAPIHISGEVNLLAARAYTDLKMSFQGVELTTATPYSAHFAGYKIEKGKISADITYHIENGSLSANHHIVIDQLQLGERVASPDAVKLPIKLAVALLKDRNGVIDLGLPVSGSLSDPQFKLGPLIWKVVVNVLTKAALAPFEFLGKLFGGGPEMKFIDFDAGSSTLDAPDRQRLESIVKALQARPNLELDVPSAYTPDLDAVALSRQQLQQKLQALQMRELAARKRRAPAPPAAAPSAPADAAQEFQLLVAEYRAELGADATLPAETKAIVDARKNKGAPVPPLEPAIAELQSALIARIKVSDNELQALGRKRARAIQEVLLGDGKIEPARLFVLSTAPTHPQSGRVRLELALK